MPAWPRILTKERALGCTALNLLATPGLGSLMAKRFLAGALQLALSVSGFLLIVAWMFHYFYALALQEVEGGTPPPARQGLGKWGLILFGIAWLWSLATSISLFREASAAAKIPAPPKITNLPPQM